MLEDKAKLRIEGGNPLFGDIHINGSKNSGLPLMAACLLTDEPFVLENLPDLLDMRVMGEILSQMGVDISIDGSKWVFKAQSIHNLVAPYELVSQLRASFLVLGPLLARFGKAKVALPGGDAIGARPVDIHIKGLQALGAQIDLIDGNIVASCPKLVGATIPLSFPSVNATEQLMMAAALATGETNILNAACEPEIVDLANCLRAMGSQVEGDGTNHIVIQGSDQLSGTTYRVMSDRIEAGTYMMATLITRGSTRIHGVNRLILPTFWETIERVGGVLTIEDDYTVRVESPKDDVYKAIDVVTAPFPGFATDLQAPFMTLATLCEGTSHITETLFENRFMHVPELNRLGADISIQGQTASVRGVHQLSGAPIHATDIRASASLILAGLAAHGTTWINGLDHVDRGYAHIEEKLRSCGAVIERVI